MALVKWFSYFKFVNNLSHFSCPYTFKFPHMYLITFMNNYSKSYCIIIIHALYVIKIEEHLTRGGMVETAFDGLTNENVG